jgi:hypothetical protein
MNEMKQMQSNYHSYLLRIWRSSSAADTPWQIMLENPHTGERHGFNNFAEMVVFLETAVSQTTAPASDEGGDAPVAL